MTADRAGVVLAGGFEESEDGADDGTGGAPAAGPGVGAGALAAVEGQPMVRHVATALAGVTNEVVVGCPEDRQEAVTAALEGLSHQLAPAPAPGEGAVAALGLALDTVEAPVVAVVAGDMAAVDETFLSYLFDRLGGNDAAVPALPDDRLQPAQAVYRTGPAREAAAAALAADDRRLVALVDHLQAGVVPPAEVQQVTAWTGLAAVEPSGDSPTSADEGGQ